MKLYNGVKVEEVKFECKNRGYVIERFLCILDDIENNPKGIFEIDVVFSQIGQRLIDNEDFIGAELLPMASVFVDDFVF